VIRGGGWRWWKAGRLVFARVERGAEGAPGVGRWAGVDEVDGGGEADGYPVDEWGFLVRRG